MNLCHCNSLSEAEIREAIADGARTVEAVFARWRCGQLCGACRSTLLKMLAIDARRRARRKPRPADR
jgi:bacterioferritin-associated ferredoxin